MAMVMSVNCKGGPTLTCCAPPTNHGCVVNSNGTPKRTTSSLIVSFASNTNGPAASINKACTFRLRQQLQPWNQPNLIPRYRRRPANNVFLPHLVASMEVEVTYIMVKPDGVQRGLVGEIISRFEKKGFLMKGLKLFECSKELAEEHYKDLKSKPFFPKLIEYITSGPVVCMAWEGVGVVASARKLIGATNPLQAEPGTIRGDLAIQTGRNIVHGSDSPENGLREIAIICRRIISYANVHVQVTCSLVQRGGVVLMDSSAGSMVVGVIFLNALWFEEWGCEWTQVQAPWLTE